MLATLFAALALLYALVAGVWVALRIVLVFGSMPDDSMAMPIGLFYALCIWALPTIALATLSVALRGPASTAPPANE